MAFLAYGAEPGNANPRLNQAGAIRLEIVDTREIRKRPVTRGPDYLYTELEIHITAVYSPQATSYTHPDGGVPTRGAGTLAPVTEAAIRHYLMQGQRQLVYNVGNSPVVIAPRANRRIDAANGPFPMYCHVQQISGWKTFLVSYGIKCFLNEDFLQTGLAPIVLSHRWRRERDVDQDHYSTVVTTGEAVFNTERLDQLSVSPDDLWDAFAHPIEDGFRRNHIQVTVAEDGASLNYCVIDREMPITVIADGVSRIEAYHTASVNKMNAEEALERILSGNYKALIETGVAMGPEWASPAYGAANAAWRWWNGEAPKPREMPDFAVPTMRHVLVARVWGNRHHQRQNLEKVARRLILRRIAKVFTAGSLIEKLLGFESNLTHDLAGRYVEASVTFRAPPIVTKAFHDLGGAAPSALQDQFFPWMPQGHDIDGILDGQAGTNPAPPGGAGTRGTWLGALVAQAIKTPAQEPDAPPAARNFQRVQ